MKKLLRTLRAFYARHIHIATDDYAAHSVSFLAKRGLIHIQWLGWQPRLEDGKCPLGMHIKIVHTWKERRDPADCPRHKGLFLTIDSCGWEFTPVSYTSKVFV